MTKYFGREHVRRLLKLSEHVPDERLFEEAALRIEQLEDERDKPRRVYPPLNDYPLP
jgi:hypothetical protein